MMWSEKVGNHLYVYRMERGQKVMIYKKWIGSSQPSRIFNTHLPDRELI